jgi:shikimate 5-dehydrogenase
MLAKVQTDLKVDYVLNEDPHRNDAIMAQLPEGSLVINATGMGKDRPGSPITDAALFPRYGIVWEMNYRGQLTFLHQAERQAATRALWIEDGWRYFLHGWAEVIAQVLHVEIGAPLLARLAKIAEPARGAAMASDTAATIPDERFSADVSADEQAT